MSEYQDFDVDSLAAFLHLTPAQVQRMAARDKLPGRRIGGQWKFSRAEIHHWFEDRIGASDEQELVEVEQVLNRQNKQTDEIRISQLLPSSNIAIPLSARTKNSVIDNICKLAADSGYLWDVVKMADALRSREALQSTALDNGTAMLHPRRPMPNLFSESFLALGVTATGIPFGGARGSLTDVFFLIASENDQVHLRILARLSRLIAIADFLPSLRAADDNKSALALIADFEESLDE